MSVNDLTNTKWVLNSDLTDALPIGEPLTTYYINFTSNGNNYTQLVDDSEGRTELALYLDLIYGNTLVYQYQEVDSDIRIPSTWANSAYRVISITGGTDATNATLIAWLEANATQVSVVDLTDTSWKMNNSGIEYIGDGTAVYSFRVNFSIDIDDTIRNYIFAPAWSSQNGVTATCGFAWDAGSSIQMTPVYLKTTDYLYIVTGITDGEGWYLSSGGVPVYSSGPTISITDGTDTTNPDLIVWLTNNATYQAPVVGNTYALTHSLTNLTHGNITFTIAPDTGYSLPNSVTVTNGTLVSYDSSTGVIVVSGDDTTEISCECDLGPQYIFNNGELTIIDAPYTLSSGELTIG